MTSKQKNGKFRFSSPRIDMGTAITPLESYEFTGFSRIGTTTIGTLPEFHDFILPLISQWNTQFLHVKFIADFRMMVMACSGHQFGLCRWFTYKTIIPPTPDVRHHSSSILKSTGGESSSVMKTAASLVKRERRVWWVEVGVVICSPLRWPDVLINLDRGLMAKLKRRQERGLSWQTPLPTMNFSLGCPFRMTHIVALV